MASIITMTNGLCGCARLWRVEVPTDFPGFITEDSNKSPNTPGYEPFVAENSTDGDYLFFVPEDYNEMSTPIKFSELDEAPDINAMSYFVGIQDEGESNVNYKFTPAQLMAYVAPMMRLPYRVLVTGETITVSGIAGKAVQSILLPNGTLTKSQFTQVNNDITYTGNSFYQDDEIVFNF
jgi:hypothetical protein